MRLYNTLFDWEELDDGQREIIWPKLLHVEQYQTDEYRKLYRGLVEYPNEALDKEIEDDETRKRFKVRTMIDGVMIGADPDKLCRVIRAYGVFDP